MFTQQDLIAQQDRIALHTWYRAFMSRSIIARPYADKQQLFRVQRGIRAAGTRAKGYDEYLYLKSKPADAERYQRLKDQRAWQAALVIAALNLGVLRWEG